MDGENFNAKNVIGFKVTNDKNIHVENMDVKIVNIGNLQDLGYKNFGFFNLDFFRWMSILKLNSTDNRIFYYLLSKMQKSNECVVTHQEIMNHLKIAKPNLSKSLKKLLEHKIILRKKLGVGEYKIKLNELKINEALAFCGKGTKENVNNHRHLAARNCPYGTEKDLWGGYTITDKKTGKKMPSNQFLNAPNDEKKERYLEKHFLIDEEIKEEVKKEMKAIPDKKFKETSIKGMEIMTKLMESNPEISAMELFAKLGEMGELDF